MARRKTRTINIVMITIVTLCGMIPAGIGYVTLREAILATFHSKPVEGIIDRFECPRRSTNCSVVVRYTHPDGSPREVVERNATSLPDFVTGSPVQVHIAHAGQGEVVRIDRPFYLWFIPTFFCLMSLPFLACATYLTWNELELSPKNKRKHKTSNTAKKTPNSTR